MWFFRDLLNILYQGLDFRKVLSYMQILGSLSVREGERRGVKKQSQGPLQGSAHTLGVASLVTWEGIRGLLPRCAEAGPPVQQDLALPLCQSPTRWTHRASRSKPGVALSCTGQATLSRQQTSAK